MSNWPSADRLRDLRDRTVRESIETAERLGLKKARLRLNEDSRIKAAASVSSAPEYSSITVNDARVDFMACLFFDMVASTTRKHLGGPNWKDLVVNQVYLSLITEIAVCDASGGLLAGYRGDGGFFVWPYTDNQERGVHTLADRRTAFHRGLSAAMRMHACLQDIINPVLNELMVRPIQGRAGISLGRVLVARVGVRDATELTVIGKCADLASKYSDFARPTTTFIPEALKEEMISTSKGGRLRLDRVSRRDHSGYQVRSTREFFKRGRGR